MHVTRAVRKEIKKTEQERETALNGRAGGNMFPQW